MDMFLKMYNVKMFVPISVRDGMQTLLQAPVPFQSAICSHAFKVAVEICRG